MSLAEDCWRRSEFSTANDSLQGAAIQSGDSALCFFGEECNEIRYYILVIDDNRPMFESAQLEWLKHDVFLTGVKDAGVAMEELRNREYHLVAIVADYLKDQLLSIVEAVLNETNIPIIVLTSQFHHSEKFASIELGVNEYLIIPHTIEEGVRVGLAHIRRYINARYGSVLAFHGDLCIYPLTRVVRRNGALLHLTAKEFDLLNYFASNPGVPLTQNDIFDRVWGIDAEYASDLTSRISRLRKKIEKNPHKPEHILTVYGIEYQFCSE